MSYTQGKLKMTYSGDDISMEKDGEDTVIRVYMPQDVTAQFDVHKEVEVQVNWITDGQRDATIIAKVTVTRNLLEEVIRE